MSTNIKLKRSSVQGKTPLTTDLELGELAINTYDGKLYMKKDDGSEAIVDITAGGATIGDATITFTGDSVIIPSGSFSLNDSTNTAIALAVNTAAIDITESQISDFGTYLPTADFTATANTWLATRSTTNLSEGSNLYYTVARANTAIDNRVTKSFVDALNVDADTLDGANSDFFLDYTNFTNTPSIPQSGVDFDPVGTDNSTNVTLAGTYDYLTITGQQITLNQIDYTTDISNLPTLYTTADANTDIDARVTKSFIDALNVDADTLDGLDSAYFRNATNINAGTLASARLPDLTVADFSGAAIQTSAEAFSDSDTVLMTAAAVADKIESYGYITSETDNQTLTWTSANTTLSISGGNDVNLSSLLDDTNTTYDLVSPGSGVLRLSDSANANDNITFIGSGDTTVSSNSTHIIISSTDTNTTYSAGTLLDLSGTTFNVDLSELTTSTADADGDYFVVVDTANAQKKLTKANINISGFNNDAGYVTTDTNTTYSISAVDSGSNAIIRLTAGGSGSGTDDVTLVAGSNITLTPSGDNITIAATDTNTTYANGAGIGLSGTTFSHLDTSTQTSLTALTGGDVISDIDLDGFGHITNIATRTLTTSNIGEGTSLYYTTARANTAIDARVTQSFVNALNVTSAGVQTNSVALGTDTTGNYVSTISSGNGLTGSGSGEGSTPTLAVNSGNGLLANSTGVHVVTSGDSSLTANSSGLFINDSTLSIATSQLTGDVALGTQTSGNYVATASGGTGVTVTGGTGEGSTPSIAIGQDVSTSANVTFQNGTFTGDVQIDGDFTVSGNVVTINVQELSVEDNLIYLNANSAQTNPDLGWAGSYNDGTYAHAGVFRDASDGVFKVFDGYTPEPDASAFIDTTHPSFGYADIQANNFIGTANNATNLNGQAASYYLDWTNVTNKPDPTITLTGAVTGTGTMTNLGNVSIATTATADPTLTINGDASGSATFTNLGNATLTLTVADDSHNHVISNVDGLQTALDGKLSTTGKAADSELLDGLDSTAFLRSNASDTMTGNLTMQSNIIVDQNGNNGGIVYDLTNGTYIPRPQGAHFVTTSSYQTGVITVKLPTEASGKNDMISFWVDIYDYAGGAEGESVSIYVYGYQYGSSSWTNTGAVVLSDRTDRDYTVRFGHDGTRHVVTIGETNSTWSYPQVSVRDFQAGFNSSYTYYDSAWDVTFETSLPSTISRTSSNNYPVAKQLKTARTISLGGDLSGSASFDGSSNITITGTVADDSHTHDGRYYTETEADNRFVNVAGDTMTGALNFGDNVKAQFGASADLQIYHSGTVSFIEDAGAGNLAILSNGPDGVLIGKGPVASYEPMIRALPDAGVELYYDNALKLATTSTGVDVSGTATATDFNSTSDRNLKKDIVKIDNALEKVQSINGYHFTYKDTDQKSVGVIAQEVEEILPEVVNGEEGHKTVSYGNMVGLLIEAIKEQQKQIEELQNLINKTS